MEPIATWTILSHGFRLVLNTTALFVINLAVFIITGHIINKLNREFRLRVEIHHEDGAGVVEVPLFPPLETAWLGLVAHLILTGLFMIASYWTSMSFLQCVLAGSTGMVALELAIPATLLVFKMLPITKAAKVGVRAHAGSLPREAPPPYEAAGRNSGVQATSTSGRGGRGNTGALTSREPKEPKRKMIDLSSAQLAEVS